MGNKLRRTGSSEPTCIPIPRRNSVAGEGRSPTQETRNSVAEGNLSPPIQATDPGISTPVQDFRSYSVQSLLVVPAHLRNLSELPEAIPHFVHRQSDELSKILTCLRPENRCKCVLLHGTPGIGKTTLAIKAANEILLPNGHELVVYINCKYIYSYADFSEKVIRQVYQSRYPANNPEAEITNRLIAVSKNFFILLLLDNFEFLLGNANDNEQENRRSGASLCPDSNNRRLITKSIGEISKCARNVKLLVT